MQRNPDPSVADPSWRNLQPRRSLRRRFCSPAAVSCPRLVGLPCDLRLWLRSCAIVASTQKAGRTSESLECDASSASGACERRPAQEIARRRAELLPPFPSDASLLRQSAPTPKRPAITHTDTNTHFNFNFNSNADSETPSAAAAAAAIPTLSFCRCVRLQTTRQTNAKSESTSKRLCCRRVCRSRWLLE